MNDQLQMAQAWMKASRSCVEVSLVLALAFICSQVFWQAVTAGTFSRAELTAPLTGNLVSAQTERETKAYKILTNADPFLSSERKSATIKAAAIDAPVTNLSLKLQGVRAKGDGGGVAFIVLPDNQQVRAEIGSEILDDVSIEYVFHDRVTLLTRGQLETLYLRNPEAVQTGLRPASLTQPALPARAETGAVSAQRFLQDVSFSVVRENGVRAGYRVTPKTDASVLASAGFQPDDIIIRVDKSPVSEIGGEDLQELFLRSNIVEFDITRNGHPKSLSVRFGRG